MQRPPLRTPSAGHSGFSLVEVAVAIAIFAIALVALLGLLPQGMSNFRKAMDTTITAQIAQRIMHDLQQSQFNEVIDLTNLPQETVPPVTSPYLDQTRLVAGQPMRVCPRNYTFRAPTIAATTTSTAANNKALRYFDEQGTELIPNAAGALTAIQLQELVYHVNVRVMPRAQLPTPNESGSAFAQVTIQVARNPNNVVIPIPSTPAIGGATAAALDDVNKPERNLFQPTKGIQIYTYYTLVGSVQGL